MENQTWLITGVSSGFGHAMSAQLLAAGKTVIGTVRNMKKVQDLMDQYPDTFIAKTLDVTDVNAIHSVVDDVTKIIKLMS
jgi:NADP-dependent 3-hydroxy acid dehydrogenase YdfG